MSKGYFTLTDNLKYKLKSMPRGRQLAEPITNTCSVVDTNLTIDFDGNCFLCFCDGFLPIPVGNVLDFNTIDEVFNSELAKIVRKDVADKKFTWCAVEHCGIKNFNRTTYAPGYAYYISLNLDESCNLACPSCRRDKIMISSGPEFDNKVQMVERVNQWLSAETNPVYITMTGNGDPLASHIIRPIIKKWKHTYNHRVELKTNGLLAKKQLQNLEFLNGIDRFSISIDAGSKEVYEDVRRPGKWEILLENLEFIKSTGKSTWFNFVVQRNNYKDLENFYKLCDQYNATPCLLPMSDWGTWTHNPTDDTPDEWTVQNGFYIDQDVLDSANEHYDDCKQVIKTIIDTYGKNVVNQTIKYKLGLL